MTRTAVVHSQRSRVEVNTCPLERANHRSAIRVFTHTVDRYVEYSRVGSRSSAARATCALVPTTTILSPTLSR